jgi:hypothetical protein
MAADSRCADMPLLQGHEMLARCGVRKSKKRAANNKFTSILSQSRTLPAFQSCTFAQVPNLSPVLTSAM